jgi:ribosomal protein S21
MGIRVVPATGETLREAIKRFNKLLIRHAVRWEMGRRKYFIKPTQVRRGRQFQKRLKARKATLLAKQNGEHPVSSGPADTAAFWRRTGKP